MNTPAHHPLVLVIDDSAVVRKIIEIILRREGGQVISYSDPVEAMRDLTEQRVPLPDVALVDLLLPKMDGYDLIRRMRAHSQNHPLAIIAVSRLDGVRPRLLARLAGANAYLTKPFTPKQLIDLVMEYSPH
jgi:twitching motility two-component system response regulator PilG